MVRKSNEREIMSKRERTTRNPGKRPLLDYRNFLRVAGVPSPVVESVFPE